MNVYSVAADLEAEQGALDDVVSQLDDAQWALPTASPRWTVADQIGHLAYFDRTAAKAVADPDEFTASARALAREIEATGDMDGPTLGLARSLAPADLLAEWRSARSELSRAARGLSDTDRVVWYGPSMGSKSFLTARLMECWAHGQDVADACGVDRSPTDRLAHIARLGFITRRWSYINRGLPAPEVEVRVELTAPSGETWTYGEDSAVEFVKGTAHDFCLVVTQRRNVHDTGLSVSPVALEWLKIAQAFAGAPTDPPTPGTGT